MAFDALSRAVLNAIDPTRAAREADTDRIEWRTVDTVLENGRYQVGGDVLSTIGRATLKVGERAAVLIQRGAAIGILAHQAKRAQSGEAPEDEGSAIEELTVGTVSGASPRARFGEASDQAPTEDPADIDIWFRNGTQLAPLGLTPHLVGLTGWGVFVQWGERDNTFLVYGVGNDVLIFELNREAGSGYGPGDDVAAELVRAVPLPTVALNSGLAFGADAGVLNLYLTDDLRLLATTATGTPLQIAYVIDCDAGTILWEHSYGSATDSGAVPAIMKWGATPSEQWIVVAWQSLAGVPPVSGTLDVWTSGGSLVFRDSITGSGTRFGAASMVRANEKWLLYLLLDVDTVPDLEGFRATSVFKLVAPGQGPAVELGRETDGLFQLLPGADDLLYSRVAGRMVSLLPLKGDVFYVIGEAATPEEQEDDPHVGWLFSFGSPPNGNLLSNVVGALALPPDERGGVVEAGDLTANRLLAPLTPEQSGDFVLEDYPEEYFPPWAWDANALRLNVGSVFCAYHYVSESPESVEAEA